jgi:hypothetical protein
VTKRKEALARWAEPRVVIALADTEEELADVLTPVSVALDECVV